MRLKKEQKVHTKHKGWWEGQSEVRGGGERTESQDSASVGVRIQVRAQVRAGSTRSPRDPNGQSVLVRVALTFSHQPSPGILPFGRHGGKQCL